MATWRRRDLERRHTERSLRVARAFRPELVLAVIALVAAGVALWQALAAQSRADLLAHDLGVVTARLRSQADALPAASPATAAPSAEATRALPPLPPLLASGEASSSNSY